MVPEEDLLAAAGQSRISIEWRAIPDVDRLTADSIGPLSDAAAALPTRLHAVVPAGLAITVETNLPDVLAATDRTVLVSRSGIIVLILEFGVVAAYAIILVAGLLGDRRRGETALVRSGGGSAGSVIGMAFLEALILAGTAAVVAPLLSVGVVSFLGSSGPLAALGVGTAVRNQHRRDRGRPARGGRRHCRDDRARPLRDREPRAASGPRSHGRSAGPSASAWASTWPSWSSPGSRCGDCGSTAPR